MQMQVKYGLSAMSASIDNDPITAGVNVFLLCNLTPHQEHVTDQRLIFSL